MRAQQIILTLFGILGVLKAAGQPESGVIQARAETSVRVPSDRTKFHLYLLMGQSNMIGRDARGIDSQVDNPGVLTLDGDGQWVVARDPIHPRVGRIAGGLGPGIPFALEMLKADTNITIGLVPCAVGGTSLKRWVKGGDLYDKAVGRAKVAAQAGTICGVLWHQGEADTANKKEAESYEARLGRVFQDLRADLGQAELPIVVGQLGDFLALTPEKYPYASNVCEAIRHIPSVIPGTGFADSAGLEDKGDKLHFSASAAKVLGARYARAMLELQGVRNAAAAVPSAVIDLWPEGSMPGRGAKAPETYAAPERTDAKRITNISRPTLSVFPAPGGEGRLAPGMIVCPGGGYNYVVYDKEGTEIAAWLNTNGISAAVLKYRTPNNRAGALQDIQRAVSVARAHAGEWNMDPRRIGVIGFSAGGNLAAKASTRFAERTYPPCDDVDRQSCRPDFSVLVYPAYLDDKNGHVSPDLDLKADIPPTLIIHSEDDRSYVPGSKLYGAALLKTKSPHQVQIYPTGGHGYGLQCAKDAKAWPGCALKWLSAIGMR